MGSGRATPPMADNASATAIERVSFEDMLASFLAGSVPAHRFVLHQFAACFMGCSLGAGVATRRAGSDRKPSAVDERRKNRARWPAAMKRFRAEAGELQDRRRARPVGILHPTEERVWHPRWGGEEYPPVSFNPQADEITTPL